MKYEIRWHIKYRRWRLHTIGDSCSSSPFPATPPRPWAPLASSYFAPLALPDPTPSIPDNPSTRRRRRPPQPKTRRLPNGHSRRRSSAAVYVLCYFSTRRRRRPPKPSHILDITVLCRKKESFIVSFNFSMIGAFRRMSVPGSDRSPRVISGEMATLRTLCDGRWHSVFYRRWRVIDGHYRRMGMRGK